MHMTGIRWQAPEFDHHPKTASWYWATIAIAIVLLAVAVWQKIFLFALFVVLAEIMVIVWGSLTPGMIHFELTEKGLKVGNRRFYPIRELKSFSADIEGAFDPDWPEVIIQFDHHFRTPLRIKAPMNWLPEIRREFRVHIPEEHFEPGLADVLQKYLRF